MRFRLLELVGKKFNHLEVIQFDSMRKGGSYWVCKCDCGNVKVIHGTSIKKGRSKSCGCYGADNIIGKRYGRLVVLGIGSIKHNKRTYICQCDCGTLTSVSRYKLTSGHTQSCGCLRADILPAFNFKHGMAKTPIHNSYTSMLDRCYNETHASYANYGGRGIAVCDRWKESFENFYNDMGERPEGSQLDRIDNDGNYCPENCKWSTIAENTRNKRDNIFLEYAGVRLCITDWAKKLNCPRSTLNARVKRGMGLKDIIQKYLSEDEYVSFEKSLKE